MAYQRPYSGLLIFYLMLLQFSISCSSAHAYCCMYGPTFGHKLMMQGSLIGYFDSLTLAILYHTKYGRDKDILEHNMFVLLVIHLPLLIN